MRVIDLLSGGSVYTIAQELWNFVMGIAYTPAAKCYFIYHPAINAIAQALGLGGNIGAWDYIKNTAFPLFMSMGAVFLNMFTLIGFCQASNLERRNNNGSMDRTFHKAL